MDTSMVHTWGAGTPVAANAAAAGFFPSALGIVAGARRANEHNVAVGSTRASDYEILPDGSVREQQVLTVVGRPSVRVLREAGGGAIVSIRRNVSNMAALKQADLAFVESYAKDVLAHLVLLSRGPLTKKELRRLGYPYGFNKSWGKGDKVMDPRKVPRRGGIANPRGVRGSVPTLSVVNKQSGKFEKSWSFEINRDDTGFEVRFINSAPWAWYLAHGTLKMQPHGPFTYSALLYLRSLDVQLQRAIARARHRKKSERLIENMVATAT